MGCVQAPASGPATPVDAGVSPAIQNFGAKSDDVIQGTRSWGTVRMGAVSGKGREGEDDAKDVGEAARERADSAADGEAEGGGSSGGKQ